MTPDTRGTILHLLRNTRETVESIANRFGVKDHTIKELACRYSISLRGRSAKSQCRNPELRDQEICEVYLSTDASLRELGSQFSLTAEGVRRILMRQDVYQCHTRSPSKTRRP